LVEQLPFKETVQGSSPWGWTDWTKWKLSTLKVQLFWKKRRTARKAFEIDSTKRRIYLKRCTAPVRREIPWDFTSDSWRQNYHNNKTNIWPNTI